MHEVPNRRRLVKQLAMGTIAGLVGGPKSVFARKHASSNQKLKIGHTCITWGTFPRTGADTTLETALKDISAEGFWSFETFPEVLDSWDRRGTLTPLLEKYPVPLRSGYITPNLIDSTLRKDEIARVIRLSKIVQKLGGTFVVLAPNSVKRDSYSFKENQSNIVAALNDYASAVVDLGLGTGLHQHTGTCIESRDEVYAVMNAVDTKNLKFAPDVGQLQKGGADAAQVVKDFLPLVKHMHLKDYKGWDAYVGYCPLGMGTVDIEAILNMVESGGQQPDILVELDPSKDEPMAPLQTVQKTKTYLQKLGYAFRS
ncbi:sugar phosphate isomerase/epimerase family protein [Edaphobacter modestus]|uniref:Inosose dehydratase n=1 Tax=Edaphobacter modestus TaxID=388466 RepID=A0A4Q7XZ64_9BACT|nr:sugar phosphate isomerase/epimerase [Edaphobacter modestus]RZU29717.1 inosose dehydratase [Edaphobacter modestus]